MNPPVIASLLAPKEKEGRVKEPLEAKGANVLVAPVLEPRIGAALLLGSSTLDVNWKPPTMGAAIVGATKVEAVRGLGSVTG